MVGDAGATGVEPVANPDLREGKRLRLIRMTKPQIAGRTGPLRQIRRRDEVVSPLALELGCRRLLHRAQRAIATIMTRGVRGRAAGSAVEEPVLRWHEWEIAVALREITELLLELASGYAGGTAGPMTPPSWFLRTGRYRWHGTRPPPGCSPSRSSRPRWRRPTPPAGIGKRPTGWRPTTISTAIWSARTAADQHATMEIACLGGASGRGRAGTPRNPAAGHPGGRGPSPRIVLGFWLAASRWAGYRRVAASGRRMLHREATGRTMRACAGAGRVGGCALPARVPRAGR